MRVHECRRCEHFAELVWTEQQFHERGRRIGIDHSFGFCKRHGKRCRAVRKCDFPKVRAGQTVMEETAAGKDRQ